jgi:PAT family beta-lactamase induction signal transducer AmpG
MSLHRVSLERMDPMESEPRRSTPPWIFGLLYMPGGVYQGFLMTALPFILRQQNVPVEKIAAISAIASAPTIWFFLWAGIVDLGFRRQTWLIGASTVSASALFVAMLQSPATHLDAITVILTLGQVVNMLITACCGGLMATTLTEDQRGRAGGWLQTGNLGGGAIGAGVTLYLASHASIRIAAIATALMVVLPSLAALWVRTTDNPTWVGTRARFQTMAAEIRSEFRSRRLWQGFIFFLSPVGAAAGLNLLSAIAVDYSASERVVTAINGFAGGLLTAAGCLVGGYLCDRMDRRHAYLLFGAVNGLGTLVMIAGPFSPSTYVLGCTFYLFTAGISYAAWTALALDILGERSATASTRYTMFNAAANAPIAYMTVLDGQGYKRFGPHGLLGVDGLSNILAATVLLLVIRKFKVA